MTNEPAGIPEDRVARILARAAELDRTSPTVQLETIRAAAIEAGISASAIERALEEFATGKATADVAPTAAPARPDPVWKRWLRRIMQPIGLFALGTTLGLTANMEEGMIVIGIGAWIWMMTRAAWRASAREMLRFQASVVAMGSGLFFGFAAVAGSEDPLVVIVMTGFLMLVLGSLLIFIHNHRKGSNNHLGAPVV